MLKMILMVFIGVLMAFPVTTKAYAIDLQKYEPNKTKDTVKSKSKDRIKSKSDDFEKFGPKKSKDEDASKADKFQKFGPKRAAEDEEVSNDKDSWSEKRIKKQSRTLDIRRGADGRKNISLEEARDQAKEERLKADQAKKEKGNKKPDENKKELKEKDLEEQEGENIEPETEIVIDEE